MATVNVDRMRRRAAEALEFAENDERRRWLASLTPEHRSRHTGLFAGLCGTCIGESGRRLAELASRPRKAN